jgi:hypothetical protein
VLRMFEEQQGEASVAGVEGAGDRLVGGDLISYLMSDS